jgi:hypothetical protein
MTLLTAVNIAAMRLVTYCENLIEYNILVDQFPLFTAVALYSDCFRSISHQATKQRLA